MKIETIRSELARAARRRHVRQLATDLGVTVGYLFHVIAGRKEPGPKVLDFLGIERYEAYRRKSAKAPDSRVAD